MPLLYEDIRCQQCQRKRFFKGIRSLDKIRYDIPWPRNVSCGETTKKLEMTFPYNKTKVHTINFVATGEIVTSGTPITPISAEVVFLVNGVPVSSKGISTCMAPGCRTSFNINTNIYAHLQEGWNDFTVKVTQSWSPAGCVTGVENLLAYIEYEYSGPPPPPPKEEPPPWMFLLKWGLIGIGAIVTLGVVVPKVVELVRKPKG